MRVFPRPSRLVANCSQCVGSSIHIRHDRISRHALQRPDDDKCGTHCTKHTIPQIDAATQSGQPCQRRFGPLPVDLECYPPAGQLSAQ